MIFHRPISITYLEGTTLKLIFQDGEAREFDMSRLFDNYAPYKKLANRDFFTSAHLETYGIHWDEEVDMEAEYIYVHGKKLPREHVPTKYLIGSLIDRERDAAGLSQKQLAERTHIDQADISKIESGKANPSLNTIERIFNALGKTLDFTVSPLPDGSTK